jgi:hypothetical protein
MESGKPFADQVAPLDSDAPARHILRLAVDVKLQGLVVGRSMWQQSLQ